MPDHRLRSPAQPLSLRKRRQVWSKGQWLVASGKDSATGESISEVVQISAINGATAHGHAGAGEELRPRSDTNQKRVFRSMPMSRARRMVKQFRKFWAAATPASDTKVQAETGAADLRKRRDAEWRGVVAADCASTICSGTKCRRFSGADRRSTFTSRAHGDDGKTTVEFGDGVRARVCRAASTTCGDLSQGHRLGWTR